MIGVCLKYMMRNYGSQLQARATIKVLEDMGLKYEILQYNKKGIIFKLKALPRIFNPVFVNDKLLSLQKKRNLREVPQVKIRNRLFDAYCEKHFVEHTVCVDYFSGLQKQAEKYDAVITCSDQLWSPAGLGTNFYNLMFVPQNVRKISFASSFGVSKIPSYQIRRTKEYLNRIEFISVRENQGQKIVKNLTGRDVPVLMDPVFVYTKQEWEKLVPLENTYDFPYILTYFLGDNIQFRKRVEEFAKQKGLKIVAIKFSNSYLEYDKCFGDIAPFDIDPDKFLNLIRGASYICTDSFHGCAFSIICEKPVAIFNRYAEGSSSSKNSRIDSLCDNLDLQQIRADENSNLLEIFSKHIDYLSVKEHLLIYIKKSKSYLNEAFDGIATKKIK